MISILERKLCILILVMVSVFFESYAQYQYTTFVPVEPEVLSNTSTKCFFKDNKGYMWFGTEDGLIRYDGVNSYHYVYNPEDKNSIISNVINVIIEDSQQKLWIGTAEGLCYYNREKDNFINIKDIPGNKGILNNVFVTALAFDKEDNLWVGTHGGGINIYNTTTYEYDYISGIDTHSSLNTTDYIVSFLYADGLMWCGTKGGVQVFNTDNLTPATLTFEKGNLPIEEVSQLIKDKAGNIWFSTLKNELIKISFDKQYTIERIIFRDSLNRKECSNIYTLCNDDKDNLWVGGINSGVNYIDTKKNKFTYFSKVDQNPKNLPTSSIRSIYIDDTGLIWIGTFNKGVYLVDNNIGKFDSYNWGDYKQSELKGKEIRAFAEDQSKNIWIACDGIGLIKLDYKTNNLKRCDDINNRLSTKYITALIFDRYGNLWVGTEGDGVIKIEFDTNTFKNYPLESNGFGDNKVSSLYEDKSGTIWSGTSGSGLFYLEQNQRDFSLLYEEDQINSILKTSYISSIIEDFNGKLWVGTLYGLYEIESNEEGVFKFQFYIRDTEKGKLNSNSIQSIYEDRNNNLWIGTADNGLSIKQKNNQGFVTFKKIKGLTNNTIRTILLDSIGNIWTSGNTGLYKFNSHTNTITNYNTSDGLVSNNFSNNSSLISSTGKLFFGSNKGFNAFYPDSIQNNFIKPLIYLTDLKINNQSVGIDKPNSPLKKHISLTSNIKLKYNQRSFTIDFVGVNYEQSSGYEYCYMLEGFDENWNCIGSKNSATYTNIDPGNYKFLVKVFYRGEVWDDAPKLLEITILPLLWKTWWAILIYIILLSTFVFFLIRIRLERIKIKNQLLMERLSREREHKLNKSKTQFFTNISHEFRTPLSLISMPLENLSAMDDLPENVKERIDTIQVSSNKMMRLVDELMDFNKLEGGKLKLQIRHGELVTFITGIANIFNDLALKKSIHFKVHAMIDPLNGWFDCDKLEKIVVNILSNAFKFTTDNGKINVMINTKSLEYEDKRDIVRYLELIIIDNGLGISKKELPFIFDKFYQAKSALMITNPGTGIGLSLTKGLVELHKGSIKVESKPNDETIFTILIPIDRQVYSEDNIFETPGFIDLPVLNNKEIKIDDDWEEGDASDKQVILIVEDNDELRKYMVLEFCQQFNILEAKDGQEGLEVAMNMIPDLIISDILMPIKTGTEFCHEIKTNLKTSHIPFILLTARTTVEDKIKGIEKGADVYITKPFSIRFLKAQVNQIIESRQKLYTQFSQDVHLLPNKVAQNKIDQAFLQKTIDYIIDNMQNSQLSVNSIADSFNLSRVQVYRKIKALTGKTVVNFIKMVRVKQSLKLMDTQKYTLAEVAFLTGFNSASYFTTCFKDIYGKAPSEYLSKKI
ncbi:two-component regulator propeller domain-containing protein [Mariniflexile sp. HMF6888]|uniref:hybrid sensor histidine kinase/response regulator transcription factor n=1 Tax=Mariniflexile sp. HMF6888 TaxID=3373086 RepID=UPI0037B937F8